MKLLRDFSTVLAAGSMLCAWAQVSEGSAAGQAERQVNVGEQVFQDAANALFAAYRQSIAIGPAKENGFCAQR